MSSLQHVMVSLDESHNDVLFSLLAMIVCKRSVLISTMQPARVCRIVHEMLEAAFGVKAPVSTGFVDGESTPFAIFDWSDSAPNFLTLKHTVAAIVMNVDDKNSQLNEPLKEAAILRVDFFREPSHFVEVDPPLDIPAVIPVDDYKEYMSVRIVPEVQAYMQDIIVGARTHRFIARGISPRSVRDFTRLSRFVASIQGFTFVSPSIAVIAAKKLLAGKLQFCEPRDEPSVAYGSSEDYVRQTMEPWNVSKVIDDVLTMVPAPV